ncbi:MAG: nuclear transport factor 2 family protein [Candidatus Saccharimonadaceae bacterium]
MTTEELLEFYYKRFSEKSDWDNVIAEDFVYVGGDMMNQDPIIGKQAYIEVISRFSRAFSSMCIQKMIVDGDNACIIGNYEFKFPNGQQLNGNVSEIWTAKDGKLQSLTIYFDTLTFERNASK